MRGNGPVCTVKGQFSLRLLLGLQRGPGQCREQCGPRGLSLSLGGFSMQRGCAPECACLPWGG